MVQKLVDIAAASRLDRLGVGEHTVAVGLLWALSDLLGRREELVTGDGQRRFKRCAEPTADFEECDIEPVHPHGLKATLGLPTLGGDPALTSYRPRSDS